MALGSPSFPPCPLPALIFGAAGCSCQPLYLGLILAQAVYVFHFWTELAT